MLQDFQFYACLVLELLLVPDNFNSDDFTCHVVDALQCLPKAAFSQEVNDFKPECDMVANNYRVVTVFVVVSIIIFLTWSAFNFIIGDINA